MKIKAPQVVIIPEGATFDLEERKIMYCQFLTMNVPPWLNWLINFTARQQWKIAKRRRSQP